MKVRFEANLHVKKILELRLNVTPCMITLLFDIVFKSACMAMSFLVGVFLEKSRLVMAFRQCFFIFFRYT